MFEAMCLIWTAIDLDLDLDDVDAAVGAVGADAVGIQQSRRRKKTKKLKEVAYYHDAFLTIEVDDSIHHQNTHRQHSSINSSPNKHSTTQKRDSAYSALNLLSQLIPRLIINRTRRCQ